MHQFNYNKTVLLVNEERQWPKASKQENTDYFVFTHEKNKTKVNDCQKLQ